MKKLFVPKDHAYRWELADGTIEDAKKRAMEYFMGDFDKHTIQIADFMENIKLEPHEFFDCPRNLIPLNYRKFVGDATLSWIISGDTEVDRWKKRHAIPEEIEEYLRPDETFAPVSKRIFFYYSEETGFVWDEPMEENIFRPGYACLDFMKHIKNHPEKYSSCPPDIMPTHLSPLVEAAVSFKKISSKDSYGLYKRYPHIIIPSLMLKFGISGGPEDYVPPNPHEININNKEDIMYFSDLLEKRTAADRKREMWFDERYIPVRGATGWDYELKPKYRD